MSKVRAGSGAGASARRHRIRVGILIPCASTSPKLYARTLVENLPADEFEVTLLAHSKPSFALPAHIRLVRLYDETGEVARSTGQEGSQAAEDIPRASKCPRPMGRMWQHLAPRGLKALAGHIREARRLAGRIRGLPIDLLHANQFGGVADSLAARLAGYRVVTTLHISTAADRFEKMPRCASHGINLLTVLASRRLIAVSHAMARDWKRYALGSRRRFSVVHHALPDRVAPLAEPSRDGVIRFGTAAMLHAKKGQRYLMEGFSMLAEKHPGAELWIAGGGAEEKALRDLVRRLPHGDRIVFLGHVEDMDTFYRSLHAFVLPSLTEPFGYVLLEAMARSLPVIASSVEAIPEIVIPEETGILVPPADPKALCEAMERLAVSENLRRKMGQAGRQRVLEQFTVESMVGGTVAAYRAALRLS